MKRSIGYFALLVLLTSVAAQAANNGKLSKEQRMQAYVEKHGSLPAMKPRSERKPSNTRAPALAGGITYDTGSGVGTAGQDSQMLGNRFDSARNPAGTMCCFPVESSGSITQITFDLGTTFSSTAIWSLYSNVMGTTADQVISTSISVGTGLNTVSTSQSYTNGSFLAGIFLFTVSSTSLVVDSGSTGGQGFHAISLNDGTTGTMLTTVTTGGGGGLNAVFRIQGDAPTPVELLNFTLEEAP